MDIQITLGLISGKATWRGVDCSYVKEKTMSHSSMLKRRREKQAMKKQLRRERKLARRDHYASKVSHVLNT